MLVPLVKNIEITDEIMKDHYEYCEDDLNLLSEILRDNEGVENLNSLV